jgi:hypothetical protein
MSGDINDSLRAADNYAIGESTSMPLAACKSVCAFIMSGQTQTYWQVFPNKDIRRCEFELDQFFQAFCMNNVQAVFETQHSIGEPVTMLPSTRAQLVHCEKDIESMLPKLHEDFVMLCELTMPMNRAWNPTTVAELKDRKDVPEHCMYKTLDENEAKKVFENLKMKCPKLAEIESIPLPPIENSQYENRHTTFVRLPQRVTEFRGWMRPARSNKSCSSSSTSEPSTVVTSRSSTSTP